MFGFESILMKEPFSNIMELQKEYLIEEMKKKSLEIEIARKEYEEKQLKLKTIEASLLQLNKYPQLTTTLDSVRDKDKEIDYNMRNNNGAELTNTSPPKDLEIQKHWKISNYKR